MEDLDFEYRGYKVKHVDSKHDDRWTAEIDKYTIAPCSSHSVKKKIDIYLKLKDRRGKVYVMSDKNYEPTPSKINVYHGFDGACKIYIESENVTIFLDDYKDAPVEVYLENDFKHLTALKTKLDKCEEEYNNELRRLKKENIFG